MNETDEPIKTVAILVLQSSNFSVTREKWQRVAEQLALRLQHPVAIVDLECDEIGFVDVQSTVQWYASQVFRRFVLMPIGLEPLNLDSLLSVVAWIHSQDLAIRIHVAQAWTTRDWVEALLAPIVEHYNLISQGTFRDLKRRRPTLLLVAQGFDSGDAIGLELASLAYHFQQADESFDARYFFLKGRSPRLQNGLKKMDTEAIHDLVIVAWRMGIDDVENLFAELGSLHAMELDREPVGFVWKWNRSSGEQPVSIEILEHSAWMHVALGCYLDALATRSVERYFANHLAPSKVIQRDLIDLDRRIDALLPSEYQGRTDEVDLQSMGSASIPSNEFGKVPWDEIWTSFCDLAMAGGPPHRGRLLEAVGAEEVKTNLADYERVVQEIRRGIEMVTGLKTVASNALGWVGVECDNEAMCVWLMRAIIVENVMVRREGNTLYLPAGPKFQVKREIKNVITSLAKTVHYWRSHLRLVSS